MINSIYYVIIHNILGGHDVHHLTIVPRVSCLIGRDEK